MSEARLKASQLIKGDENLSWLESQGVLTTHRLRSEDFHSALRSVQAGLADAAGAPKIPEVKWEDVGQDSILQLSW